MLASINPLGERARQQRWGITFGWYLVGSAIGGGAMGAVLAALGGSAIGGLTLGDDAVLLAAAIVAGLGVTLDVAGGVPSPGRQVDERWIGAFRGWVYGVAFGAQLGTGVVTQITTAAVYTTWALAFLSGSVAAGIVVGVVFGATRAAMLLWVRGARDGEMLRATMRRLHDLLPPAHRGAVAAQAAVVVIALAGVMA